MSKFVEVTDGIMVNVSNVNTIEKNNAKNGGKPALIITYADCTGRSMVFDDRHDMEKAYRKIKESNDI